MLTFREMMIKYVKRIIIFFSLSILISCGTTNLSNYFQSHSYIVQPGDTLTMIAFRYKTSVDELLKLNQISKNSIIKPGQKIWVKQPANQYILENQTKTRKPQKRRTQKSSSIISTNEKIKSKGWLWPTSAPYNEVIPKRILKGLNFSGKVGASVKSTAAGKVIYSGNGLKQYGNLVIIKHSENLLSAYAFNKENLVKEDEKVKAGEIIAKMGTKNKKGHLYFEIRKNGKPINPLYYLEPRK